jgi:hypothetical protein
MRDNLGEKMKILKNSDNFSKIKFYHWFYSMIELCLSKSNTNQKLAIKMGKTTTRLRFACVAKELSANCSLL